MLRRHHEGVFVEEQADNGTRNSDGSKRAERKQQNQWNNMSQRNTAPPIMVAEFAVSHFAGGEHGSVGGEGIEFSREGHQ